MLVEQAPHSGRAIKANLDRVDVITQARNRLYQIEAHNSPVRFKSQHFICALKVSTRDIGPREIINRLTCEFKLVDVGCAKMT